MKRLISTLILASIAWLLFAQTPTVTTNLGTYNASSLSNGQFYYNGTTSIKLEGKWNNAAFERFRASIKIEGNIGFENNYLLDVDMSTISLDTSSPITSTSGLFKACRHLRTIKLPTTDLGNVDVSMKEIFYHCDSLRSPLDLSVFTSITDLNEAFASCSYLPSVKFATINNATVGVAFGAAFFDCFLLDSLDISGFNRISDLSLAFCNCFKLEYIKLPASNLASESVSFLSAFSNCPKLVTCDMSGFTNISNMAFVNNYNYALKNVVLPTVNNYAGSVDFNMAYGYCTLLDSIDMSAFTSISKMEWVFNGCEKICKIKMPTTNSYTSPVSFNEAFRLCSKLKYIDISMFSNISDMNQAFLDCVQLKHIELPKLNLCTDSISFSNAFSLCTVLDSIDLSGFKAIKSFHETFELCDRLTSVRFGTVPSTGTSNSFGYVTSTPGQYNNLANVNCLKYFPANTVAPVGWENVIIGDRASLITIYDKYAYYSQIKYGPFFCPTAFTADSIRYSRTMSNGVYEGITLPFDATSDNGCIYSYTRNSNDTVYFSNTTNLEANIPYLIQGSGTISFGGRNKLVPVSNFILPTIIGEHVFVGNYASQSKSTNLVMDGSGKKFVRGTANVLPFRSYFIGDKGYNTLIISAPNTCDNCKPITATRTITACPTAIYKGVSFSADTTFKDTITNAVQCDSIITINIIITPPTKNVYFGDCEQVEYKGVTYLKDTTFIENIPSLITCDTIQTTNISVESYYTHGISETFCDSVKLESGFVIYKDTILVDSSRAAFCFIIVDTIQIIKPYRTITISNCGPVSYEGLTFYESTKFSVRIPDADEYGCDSVITVILKVDDCVGVSENKLENVVIYPNPVKDILNVSAPSPVQATIYDLQGKVRMIKEIQSKDIINLAVLPKGIYLVKLSNEQGSYLQKIIKE